VGAGYAVRAELPAAHELGEQLLKLAQRLQDPALLLETHILFGSVLVWQGELTPGRMHLEQAIALYDPQQHAPHAFVYGQDPGVVGQANASYVLWLLGYPDEAAKKSQGALALAQQLAHPHSVAYALNWAAMLQQFCFNPRKTHEWAEAAIAFTREQGFEHLLAVVTALRGWALIEQGERREGLAQLRESLAAWQTTGVALLRPYYLGLLAEGYAKGGQIAEGLATLAEALEVVNRTGERWWEAELYRLYGELSLRIGESETSKEESVNRGRGESETSKRENLSSSPIPRFSGSPVLSSSARFPVSSPEACFHTAIEIARRQGAKSLELRATVSLCQLWQQQGEREQARQTLAEMYHWFTEGFDTADLKKARALLEE